MYETKPRARRRVVLCMGEFCNLGRRADRIYRKLQPLIDDLNGDTYPPCIKLETARCLSMCGQGPNLVIYPEDIMFSRLDENGIETIIREHISPCESFTAEDAEDAEKRK
jgi:(2Fe-2S) ferredoxin